jgi:hypothetical protein
MIDHTMTAVLKALRDPVWQAIAALAAIIALIIAWPSSTLTSKPDEVAIVHIWGIPSKEDTIPRGDIEDAIRDAGLEGTALYTTPILIFNRGSRAIVPERFVVPFSITARHGSVLLVKACNLGSGFGGGYGNFQVSAPASPVKAAGTWKLEPLLLNAGEIACVRIFLSVPDKNSGEIPVPSVTARIVDASITEYRSAQEFNEATKTPFDLVFRVSVHIQGVWVYVFITLQAALFLLTYLILWKAKIHRTTAISTGMLLVPVVIFATSSAQNIVALQTLAADAWHPAIWITSIAHVLYVGILWLISLRKSA